MNELRIKHKLIVHVIMAAVVLLLMYVCCWGLYLRDEAPEPDVPAFIITVFIMVIGSVILFFVARILITQPYVLYMNEEGFSYNPGGVPSGFISWDNVEQIKAVKVKTTQGNLPGPVLETAIGIKLKNPELYKVYSNSWLRPLLRLNKKMYDVDLFIRISDLGEHKPKALELLQKFGNNNQPIA
jgi:hypothetical protein